MHDTVLIHDNFVVGLSGVLKRPDLVWFRHATAAASNTLLLQATSAVLIQVRFTCDINTKFLVSTFFITYSGVGAWRSTVHRPARQPTSATMHRPRHRMKDVGGPGATPTRDRPRLPTIVIRVAPGPATVSGAPSVTINLFGLTTLCLVTRNILEGQYTGDRGTATRGRRANHTSAHPHGLERYY